MFVIVQASNPGRDGRYRAGRFFPNGEQVKLEVVPDDKVTVPAGRPLAHGPLDDKGKPSMTHISKSGYDQVIGDVMLSKMSDEATAGSLANAALDTVKRQAADTAGKLAEANAKIATLEAEIAALKGDSKPKVEAKGKGKGDKE